ncbi:hypothetical protein HJC23_006759 [Cyclotella cryptica]|uniref:HMG box domain-containing protein n=1 Tax=Cyclotella cryptica TaxID=29204 RepID=A0ABD3PR36_9STRA|eukprot:CCRYP_012744-RA/>CCRYP_012744-RA protein AED:0.15 eAED:0.15 QI:0/-1/0/1/-1/1/1/0/267
MKVEQSKQRSNEIVPPVPKRPLTPYNLFYILERNYILQQQQKADSSLPMGAATNIDPFASERPQKYRSVVLPSNWYVVGMNRTKRSDHKNHGLISFKSLSKTISEMWKEVDEDVKAYCKKLASVEMKRYRKEQELFKEKYGEEAFAAQKKKYKKRHKDLSDSSGSKRTRRQSDEVEQDESESRDSGRPNLIEIQNLTLHNNYCTTRRTSGNHFFTPENDVYTQNSHQRRGSGEISEISIGEWLMTGQEAAKAFDDDEISFRNVAHMK